MTKYNPDIKISLDRQLLWLLFLLSGLTFLYAGCEENTSKVSTETYKGPIFEFDTVSVIFSDSGYVRVNLESTKELMYLNRDREWPNGMELTFYDKDGSVTSHFRADRVYYFREGNYYQSNGNVILKSVENGDQLNTEELFWEPDKEKFYTDKFVTILSGDEVHKGEGMTSNQDFSSYRILKPTGTLVIEEEL